MRLRLTDRPPLPGMPAPGTTVNLKNDVHRHVTLSGPLEVRQRIDRELQGVHHLLERFSSIIVTGTLRIVVVPEGFTTFEGELTCYHEPSGRQRDALLHAVDSELFRIKCQYRPWISRCEFTMEQSMVY